MAVKTSGATPTLLAEARLAVCEGTAALLDHQRRDGYWEARVDSDPGATAQHLLMTRFLDRPHTDVDVAMLEYLRRSQLAGGGWPAYPGGPPSLDVSLLCYAALKFGGVAATSPDLERARQVIVARGGLEAVGVVPRAPLAVWHQVPFDSLTYVSPKLLLLPPPVPPNLRDLGIFLQAALSFWLLSKTRAAKSPPAELDLSELRTGGRFPVISMRLTDIAISSASRWVDALLPARALDHHAADWLAGRQNRDGLWTGMSLFTNRCLMALRAVNAERYASAIDAGLAGLARLQVSAGAVRWQQIHRSPVLDTAIAVVCLAEADVRTDDARLRSAFEWLIAVQARRPGDWRHGAPGLAPGGWSFSPENDRNADTDTTLHVLEALALAPSGICGRGEALSSGLRWLLGMQNRDGSWGTFARAPLFRLAVPRELVRHGMWDTGAPDVTARAVRALSRLRALPGLDRADMRMAVMRGYRFLAGTQRPDGAWDGRWAVNYTYGTAQGLTACACVRAGAQVVRARRFLHETQRSDGGWGESPESFAAGEFVPAPSTTTQTGLVLLGLLASGLPEDPVVSAGVRFLLDCRPPGEALWVDQAFSQVMLPGHLYFQNALFAGCLGLMATARYLRRGREFPGTPE